MNTYLLPLIFFTQLAVAEVNTCKAPDGTRYFTDGTCPSGYALSETRKTDRELAKERYQAKQEKELGEWKTQQEVTRQQASGDESERRRKEFIASLRKGEAMDEELKRWREYKDVNSALVRSGKGIRAVDSYLRGALKDPYSLQIIDCSPVMTNGVLYKARCKYRAKNSFGGYVVSNQVFHMYVSGEVEKVTDYTGKALAFE